MTALEPDPERDAALRAALPHVEAGGWTMTALEAGIRAAGHDPVAATWMFPRGIVSAIEAWADLTDRDVAAAAGPEVAALRIPDRIRAVVAARLRLLAPHKRALRGALGLLALPWNAIPAARIAARTADAMWHAAGDASADFSWYTRRATLAAIYGATLAYWLRDEDPEVDAALGFLDRRLADLGRLRRRRAA